MESQPQNPEFRNNPENFTHALYRDKKRKIVEKRWASAQYFGNYRIYAKASFEYPC